MLLSADIKEQLQIYPLSIHETDHLIVCMAKGKIHDHLLVFGEEDIFHGSIKKIGTYFYKECHLTCENADVLRELFPFTRPVSVLKSPKTIGLGDRLGIATYGHISLLKRYPYIRPVFAQQSMRELTLTNRTYHSVISDVVFAVFRENYTLGYGADGDHLKNEADIKSAIIDGCSMITLDCSDHICSEAAHYTADEVHKQYQSDPLLEEKYLHKTFSISPQISFSFDELEFKRTVLIYKKALEFCRIIYQDIFANNPQVDLEISIDETLTPTTPLQHFFVANELKDCNALPVTLAPRFCGEFQKGIDYIGDVETFASEFKVHAEIAKHFGYKISVHSGSDKFAVFSTIGKYTDGIYHVKTAGTNWLEAMRVVAQEAPNLYREIHQYALQVLPQARAYYHIRANENNLPDITALKDRELPSLMDQDDCRQIIHITYGLILTAKNEQGDPLFADRLYTLWYKYPKSYEKNLVNHIEHHLIALGN